MRAGTETEIRFAAPVLQIVARTAARQTPIGNFVVLVARGRETRAGGFVGIGDGIVRRDRFRAVARASRERFLAEAAAFVNFEHVDGNVLGADSQELAEGLLPRRTRLVREPGDEVHADVVEAGSTENARGFEDVGAAVHATGGLKFAIVEGLRTEADAVETSGKPSARFFGSDGFGIGFEGHFGSGGTSEVAAERINYSRKGGGIKKAGRSAAEIDSVDDGSRQKACFRG